MMHQYILTFSTLANPRSSEWAPTLYSLGLNTKYFIIFDLITH